MRRSYTVACAADSGQLAASPLLPCAPAGPKYLTRTSSSRLTSARCVIKSHRPIGRGPTSPPWSYQPRQVLSRPCRGGHPCLACACDSHASRQHALSMPDPSVRRPTVLFILYRCNTRNESCVYDCAYLRLKFTALNCLYRVFCTQLRFTALTAFQSRSGLRILRAQALPGLTHILPRLRADKPQRTSHTRVLISLGVPLASEADKPRRTCESKSFGRSTKLPQRRGGLPGSLSAHGRSIWCEGEECGGVLLTVPAL